MFDKSYVFIFISCFFLNSFVDGKQWALLISGSKGWENYRHQADLCHAYQLLRANGVPQENIITMFYDDLANDVSNPNKGVLINKPGGPNVYEGIVKDYTKNDLTVKNFLNVLKGDKDAMKGIGSGRVLESGPQDVVFLYIIDHGDPGTVTINDEYLYADQLNDALKYMTANKKYYKMVIYVEACESGSMFDSILAENTSIFAMTAAAPDESSYVRYYSDELSTYIGDAFSTIWMEQVDKFREESKPLSDTLFKEYEFIRSNVNRSHVMVYGDYKIGFDYLYLFISNVSLKDYKPEIITPMQIMVEGEDVPESQIFNEEWVSSKEIQTKLLEKKIKKSKNLLEQLTLKRELQTNKMGRSAVDKMIDRIISKICGDNSDACIAFSHKRNKLQLQDYPCYRKLVNTFNKHCISSHDNPYVSRHFHKFINVCSKRVNIWKVASDIKAECKKSNLRGIKKLY